jgi:hypothetical protein
LASSWEFVTCFQRHSPFEFFNGLAALTLPKASLAIIPPENTFLPSVAFSYGEAFHTEDPRIGTGTAQPTLLAPSRAYQFFRQTFSMTS